MFNANQLRELIIKPTLINMVMFSREAVGLLIFTCAVESEGGTYLKKGDSLGIYQMETKTYVDIWENYIKNKQSLMMVLSSNFAIYQMPDEERLIWDLRFATIMARIHYERTAKTICGLNGKNDLWYYYRNYYNTSENIDRDDAFLKYHNFISG
jgi:hypothetical protein